MTGVQNIFTQDSSLSEKFTGNVMRGDIAVATVKNDIVVDFNRHAPLYLQRTKNFCQWLEDRGADTDRSYMRTILRHFGVPLLNIAKAVKVIHAVSLTDSFWLQASGENLKYTDVVFKSDIFFKAALCGDPDVFELPKVSTPEITNIGSYNKGWRLQNSSWVLFKAGKPLEIFSELFTSKLATALGLDAVRYYADNGFIACKNFVDNGWCFEPAKALVDENLEYAFNAEVLAKFGVLKQYLDLIFMDALVRNGDRHEFNYGILTSEAGTARLAPNFDNNMALFWNGVPTVLKRKDVLVSEFISVYKAADYILPVVTEDLLRKVFKGTLREYSVDVCEDTVIDFCMNAYVQMKEAKD